jgi:endonuclease/exonuclease/phosphatase family metal-dependent hydrolase
VNDGISPGRTWRVATWNVHGMRGGVDEIASVVNTEEVDILLLQESGPRTRLRALGETLSMDVSADPRAFPHRRIQNAVLVRGGLAAIVHNRLRRFSGGSHLYPRGVLVADVDERVSMMSVHLGLSGMERAQHVAQLMRMIEGSSRSFVLGADLNALPGDPGPASLARLTSDCWETVGEGSGATYPSHAPTARIDYLFAGRAFRPARAWTAGGTVSDHLMVVAELAITEMGEDEATVRGS